MPYNLDPMGADMRLLKAGEIQQARTALRMSQAEFAEAFRLNVRTLQEWDGLSAFGRWTNAAT